MKIGILSDTHGDIGRSVRALDRLLERACKAILHCGDIGSMEVLDELAERCRIHAVPLHAVLGNVDEYDPELRDYTARDGVRIWGMRADLEFDGRRIAILHGHHAHALEAAIASGQFNYVLTGHTHVSEDRFEGTTRVINPGAVHRANPPSVAVLDLSTGEVDFIQTR